VYPERIKNDKKTGVSLSKLDRSTWQTVRLGDVCEIISGGTPATHVPEYWDGDIPWLSVVDFNTGNKYVTKTEKSISEAGLQNSSTHLLNTNEIIISARGTVGVLSILSKPMAFNQSCFGLCADSCVCDSDFLYYAMNASIAQMRQNSTMGVFSALTYQGLKSLSFLLPSHAMQKQISHSLSAIDAQISALRRLIAKQEAIKKATLKLLLTPKPGWQTVKLSKVTTEIKERIACARVALTDYVSTETLLQNCGGVSIASSAPSSGSCIKYEEGDILISNIRPYLKKIWQASHDGGCSNDVIVYRANAEIATDFLYQTLSADSFFEYDMAYATGTKMPRGDRLMMALYEFALPSLEEQRRITQALHAYDSIIANQKKQLAKMQQLKAGAMRYFFG